MRLLRRLLPLTLVLSLCTGTAHAQAVQSRWEVEVHVGGALPITSSHGDTALPPINSVVSSPITDTARIVPSWFFGDGAAQFNAAVASLPLFIGTLVPIDNVLQARFGKPQAGVSGGVRVSRMLTPRLAAELSFDAANTRMQLAASSVSAIEVSRLSYDYTMNNLLSLPSARGQTVTAAARVDDDRGRQFTTAGALLVNVVTTGRLVPYVAVGAGAITHGGGTPSAQLTANYAFTFPPPSSGAPPGLAPVTVSDGDAVIVRTVVSNQFALGLGAGVKYATGSRLGVRVDVRDYVTSDSQKTVLDATPTRVPSASSITIGSAPRLVFGAGTIRQTLSAPNVSNFQTYAATGSAHDLHLTAGVYWRF